MHKRAIDDLCIMSIAFFVWFDIIILVRNKETDTERERRNEHEEKGNVCCRDL